MRPVTSLLTILGLAIAASSADHALAADPSPANASIVRDLGLDNGGFLALWPPTGLATVGNRAFFLTRDDRRVQLWTSDGTAVGTRVIAAPCQSTFACGQVAGLGVLLGSYVFAVETGGATQLWVSDGTEAGTRQIGTTPDIVISPTSDPSLPSWAWATRSGTLVWVEFVHTLELVADSAGDRR